MDSKLTDYACAAPIFVMLGKVWNQYSSNRQTIRL